MGSGGFEASASPREVFRRPLTLPVSSCTVTCCRRTALQPSSPRPQEPAGNLGVEAGRLGFRPSLRQRETLPRGLPA